MIIGDLIPQLPEWIRIPPLLVAEETLEKFRTLVLRFPNGHRHELGSSLALLNELRAVALPNNSEPLNP